MFGRKKKKAEESQTVTEDMLQDNQVDDSVEGIETELSIPDEWNMRNEDRYVYAFHNTVSPKLKKNQISVYGIELKPLMNDGYSVNTLIRSTVKKPISFGNTNILLLDPDKNVVARKEFDMSKLGTLPPNSARPLKFTFRKEDLVNKVDLSDNDDWAIAFELKKKHQLDLPDSWENKIPDETKAGLEKIVANASPLKPGEVNFMGISANQTDQKDLSVTVLIRNGSEKNISFQQIPLAFKDGSNEVIAKGTFKLEDFEVKANTSKPWTFIFPSSMIQTEELDLSKWQVFPVNNQ
ncbi:accessory Sec system S-layer assembly protein [Salinibacillus aidingensis]|uniref:Accessory Sec system S-layer assembly protein n=1 Tax=Salinibacillus aidingensis TaxID=237684 RepID=A0ABN1AZ02_9BACI